MNQTVRMALPAVDRDIELLLETAMRPKADAARSWAAWKQRNNLDDVTWEQHRSLALIAPRLPDIDPDCPYLPRVKGLAKAGWTKSQIQVQASTKAVDVLASAGIPVMFIKGGAFLAAGYRHAAPRVSADLDIVVPRARFGDAVRALYGANWRAAHSVEYASNHWRFQSGLNLLSGDGDIDVHHQPFHGPRLDDASLEAIWQRARPVTFRGRAILVPSVEDMAVFTAAHAFPNDSEVSTASWALDLQLLLSQPVFDTGVAARIAGQLGVSASCVAAMSLLIHLAPSEPAARFLAALAANDDSRRALASASSRPARWTVPFRRALRPLVARVGVPNTRALLSHYAEAPSSSRLTQPLRRLAGRLAVHAGGEFESESAAYPFLPERLREPVGTRAVTVAALSGQHAVRHEFRLEGRGSADRFLILDVEFARPPVDRRCRLELVSGGIPIAQPVLWRRAGAPPKATACFSVPLRLVPAGATVLAMESVPEYLFHGTPPESALRRTEAIPFRITRLAWC